MSLGPQNLMTIGPDYTCIMHVFGGWLIAITKINYSIEKNCGVDFKEQDGSMGANHLKRLLLQSQSIVI